MKEKYKNGSPHSNMVLDNKQSKACNSSASIHLYYVLFIVTAAKIEQGYSRKWCMCTHFLFSV